MGGFLSRGSCDVSRALELAPHVHLGDSDTVRSGGLPEEAE